MLHLRAGAPPAGDRESRGMQSGWVRWIAYLVLAALVVVTSCQAMAGPVTVADMAEATG